jgi:hypothetical protein
MTLRNERLAPKISELFDILQSDMEVGDYGHADVILARLSKYFHLFDDEHIDYYQYCQNEIEIVLGNESDWYSDEDDYLFDWDGDALASAGFGTDEDY